LRGLALNFAITHQTENPRAFSEVGENKQLLITIMCAQHGHLLYIERYIINLEGASPLWAGLTP